MHLVHHTPIEFPEFSDPLVAQKVSDLPVEMKKVAREARQILNTIVQLRKRLTALKGECEAVDQHTVNDTKRRQHQCLVCGAIGPFRGTSHREKEDGNEEASSTP